MMMASSMLGVIGLVVFGVLRSNAVLSAQNTGINVSASRARLVLDQIGERVRYAMETPSLVTAAGVDVTGTTADGLIIKKLIGTPYVVKESGGTTGDIAATATTFCVEFNPELPIPMVGDCMLMESTSRPQLEITAVAVMADSGGCKRRLITTGTAIGELARPLYYRVGGFLYRKEAYTFVALDATANPRFELRHYSQVKASTNYSTATNYIVEANSYRRLNNMAFYTNSTSNGADLTTLNALCDSSNKPEYISRQKNASTFTSVPLSLRLWSLNR